MVVGVEADMKITGVMIYYLNVCTRKLWYFFNSLNMENENESVQLGKLLDEASYKAEEKHINIDDVINIDFIRDKHMLHEVKKSRKIEEAGLWQTKYYLYYLKKRGVKKLRGEVDYPLLKKTTEVILAAEDEERIKHMCEQIEQIVHLSVPPGFVKKNICKSCAYYDLCGV